MIISSKVKLSLAKNHLIRVKLGFYKIAKRRCKRIDMNKIDQFQKFIVTIHVLAHIFNRKSMATNANGRCI